MAIPLQTTKIIDNSSAGSGTQDVSNANEMHVHRIYATISAAADIDLQASPDDGDTWFDLGTLESTGVMELDRPWPKLRVSWSGNTGNITVFEEHTYDTDKATV